MSLSRSLRGVFYLVTKELSSYIQETAEASHTKNRLSIEPSGLKNHQEYRQRNIPWYKDRTPAVVIHEMISDL